MGEANDLAWAEMIDEKDDLIESLTEALAWFLDDERFQVAVGGNPNVVERMLDQARAVLCLARGEK